MTLYTTKSSELGELPVTRLFEYPDYHPPQSIKVALGPKLRSGIPIVCGFMQAGALIPENYVIPHYDPRTKEGYQRLPQQARINELAVDLRKNRTDLPTAVLLNIRNREAKDAVHDGELDLRFMAASLRSALRSSVSKFFVVDGQHRILALEKLIEGDPGLWLSYVIPFVCMLGATEEQEMDQFYIVNSKAKSVRTDLALELLKQRAHNDPDVVMSALIEKGKDWQVTAQELVELLSDTSVWTDKVRFPSMEKGHTVMPSASMVASLRPLLASPYFKIMSREQQVQILDAFWRGLRNVMREAFDEPEQFVIQKGVGVIAMHALLVNILEIIRANGGSLLEPESYERLLADPIQKLQGDDGSGKPVFGLDFWRTAPLGAAGSYSSSAGKRVLIAKLEQLLPPVSVV
jgi:DGQHR domain-containing protein